MNELLAIILIVFVCCAMFLAWLISMATCPDRMVNLIAGGSGSSSRSSRNESCELVPKEKDEELGELNYNDMDNNMLNKPIIKSTSKKLSVVPEQDEQLTMKSTTSPPRPSILQSSYIIEDEMEDYPIMEQSTSSGHRLYSRFSESHIDQIEDQSSLDSCYEQQQQQPLALMPVTLPARIPVSSGGPVAVTQPYSKIGDRVFKCYSVGYVNQTQAI